MPVSNNISIVISTKRLNITVQTASPSAQNAQDTDRDYIMTAAQGMEYGVIDEVLSKRS